MTIVIVAHGMEALKKLCTRGIWINNGVIAMDGNFEEVSEAYLKECA